MKSTYGPGPGVKLTENQLKCLLELLDGKWHDRHSIQQALELKRIAPNISSRIFRPLREKRIIEEKDVPVKDGSRKMKKAVRINHDPAFKFHFYELMANWCKERHAEAKMELKRHKTSVLERRRRLYNVAHIGFDRQLNDLRQKTEKIDREKDETSWKDDPYLENIWNISIKIERYCKTPSDARLAAAKVVNLVKPELYEAYSSRMLNPYEMTYAMHRGRMESLNRKQKKADPD